MDSYFFKIYLKFSTSKWNEVWSEQIEKQQNSKVLINTFATDDEYIRHK